MDALRIEGGHTLDGRVMASGSKNAALPIMAAALMADGPVELERVPRVADVATLAALLGHLGVAVERGPRGYMRLETFDRQPIAADEKLVRAMRASFCVLGPLLARRGRAVVALPGGCEIGTRPVDLHLRGLAALGAELHVADGYVVGRAARLRGTRIRLYGPRGPSVTGTANVMCAAVLAAGTTLIEGAAREPEIVDLGRFLNAIGARITGLGNSTIRIEGVRQLRGTRHRVIADRIETATLLVAAAITGGSVTVAETVPRQLTAVFRTLRLAGCAVHVERRSVSVSGPDRPRAVDFAARPYPGLPTDVQAQLLALLTVARGTSAIRDHVFPHRYRHAAQLARMGARIRRVAEGVAVRGVDALEGGEVVASDLRASAALVLAGLVAEGTTTVVDAFHLRRGYESLDAKLSQLGAAVTSTLHVPAHRPAADQRRRASIA